MTNYEEMGDRIIITKSYIHLLRAIPYGQKETPEKFR